MKIQWTSLALTRLQTHADYIAQNNPRNAQRWLNSIFKRVDLLEEQPELGHIQPLLQDTSIRELALGNYRVIYQIHTIEDYIAILTIANYREDLQNDGLFTSIG